MQQLIASLLIELDGAERTQLPRAFLADASAALREYLQADLAIAYELIPETGGAPKWPPIWSGNFVAIAQQTGATKQYSGALGQLIGRWEVCYEEDALAWHGRFPSETTSDFTHFIHTESIQSFIFLPIAAQKARLAAFVIAFRQPQTWPEETRRALKVAGALIGARLRQFERLPASAQTPKKRKAIAHTLYGKTAVVFKEQIDELEREIGRALGKGVPSGVTERLQMARQTVFEEMRNLVIEASGDLLVDLETMSLAKALQTAVAALKRAWPSDQRVAIDLYPIPIVVERQSLALRQLLYTLVLEAVGNAIKHGGPAAYINIDLNWADNQIFVQVIDHGRGFDPQSQPFSEYGLGFWQTYIRQKLGGVFAVSSQPGFGTVVTATIPVIPARMAHDAE